MSSEIPSQNLTDDASDRTPSEVSKNGGKMISFITKALGLKNLATYAIVAVLALALAGGAYWYLDHRGYERAAVIYQARIDAEHAANAEADANEQRRQTIANNAAKKREAEALAKIEQQETDNLELRRKLASEAN